MHELVPAPAVVATRSPVLGGASPSGPPPPAVGRSGRRSPGSCRAAARAREVEQLLLALVDGLQEERPPVPVPGAPPVEEAEIAPRLLLGLVPAEDERRPALDPSLEVAVHPAAAHVPDPQLLAGGVQRLIEEARVHADNDGDLLAQHLPDLGHLVPERSVGGIPLVAVLVATPEDGVHHQPAPGDLERVEARDVRLVGRAHALPPLRVAVVQDHAVYAEQNHLGLDDLQPPQEEPGQKAAELEHVSKGEGLKEALHLVGRGHLIHGHLDRPGVAAILGQLVEAGERQVGAVQEEAKELMEEERHRQALRALPDRAEEPLQEGKDPQLSKIAAAERDPRPTREPVGGRLQPVERSEAVDRGAGIGHLGHAPAGLGAARAAGGYNQMAPPT